MITQLIQTTTETLSTSNGMVFQILLTTIFIIGPAFVAAAIVLVWPLGKSRELSPPAQSEPSLDATSGASSGIVLRFRRKLPHLETDVPADIADVSPHGVQKTPVPKREKRTSNPRKS